MRLPTRDFVRIMAYFLASIQNGLVKSADTLNFCKRDKIKVIIH